jgi:hypothetical protein
MVDLLNMSRSRIAATSKKQLAAWAADKGITLAMPTTQARGWFTLTVQLPPRTTDERASGYTFRAAGIGIDPGDAWSYRPHRYLPGGATPVPLSDQARADEDARVARLNEIQNLVDAEWRNVSLKYV